MMLQYLDIKKQYKDFILFYRLGDFYEMFFDDAILASRELELTLTGRDCGEPERAPMCGVPYHSAEGYIGKLISKGYKVAICEQMEDPSTTKGLVKREVVREITPGTVFESDLIPANRNNYLCALNIRGARVGICFADVSTGEISATSLDNEGSKILNELGTYSPKEIILNVSRDSAEHIYDFATTRLGALCEFDNGELFALGSAMARVREQFGSDFVVKYENDEPMLCAMGAILEYICITQKTQDVSYINNLNVYGEGQYLDMDLNTRRNLELCETMRNKEKRGSLFGILDKTKTAMGARMLRSFVEHPLVDVKKISMRQSAVAELVSNFVLREEISHLLSPILDLERLMTKVVYGSAGGKDLRAIASTVSVIPEIKNLLFTASAPELVYIRDNIDTLEDIYGAIDATLVENPPFSVREGGFIKDGVNKDVDMLRSIMTNGKGWIEKIEEQEREATGIKTLKIGYNRVFGYYIEVTKSLISQVPETYIRKQTLSNCERYITEELKQMETTVLGAQDKLASLEYDIFITLRDEVARNLKRIQKSATLLAKLDAYVSLAEVAMKNNYVCPEVDYSDIIDIKDGRHPVVEQFVKDSYFVPNDTFLNTTSDRLALITGPNMAGKSTYMRQSALIVVMAQIGSFVPAKSARIGVVDKLFTRVGASDDLASGQSTFMLEMTEVAYILENATKRSFIIYDEIGRGTSTFDGMSMAKAIAEYTASKKIGAKSMFATHYHELTSLEDEIDGVVNYNIAAKKRGEDIIFLRKIVKGPTDDSYGIEVSKLAGVPNEVVKRAKVILNEIIEQGGPVKPVLSSKNAPSMEMSIEDIGIYEIADRVKKIDINTLTPIEAMNFIFELKKLL
ncbi:MAG: DNA mismatch repair protein MutS [Ruminococcaceae bacterium]|nr:DNA mismatch repair protein MutS [Oscillospiraceae bacterium]